MEVRARHSPAPGIARVVLAGGEAVQARPDALMACSYGVTEAPGPRRGGEGQAVFTAPGDGGWLDLAPPGATGVHPLEVAGGAGWCVAGDALLARPASVRVEPRSAPLEPLFGGEPGFLRHATGAGTLVLACAGAVETLSLAGGEAVTVTPGYLLAYPDTLQCRLRALDPAGPQSMRTGRGLAMDFAGPGALLLQARPGPAAGPDARRREG